MKVESNLLNVSLPQNDRLGQPVTADGGSKLRAESRKAADDGVELGSQVSLLAATQTAGQSDQSGIVQKLRALVQSGQYTVDVGALSNSIVQSAANGF